MTGVLPGPGARGPRRGQRPPNGAQRNGRGILLPDGSEAAPQTGDARLKAAQDVAVHMVHGVVSQPSFRGALDTIEEHLRTHPRRLNRGERTCLRMLAMVATWQDQARVALEGLAQSEAQDPKDRQDRYASRGFVEPADAPVWLPSDAACEQCGRLMDHDARDGQGGPFSCARCDRGEGLCSDMCAECGYVTDGPVCTKCGRVVHEAHEVHDDETRWCGKCAGCGALWGEEDGDACPSCGGPEMLTVGVLDDRVRAPSLESPPATADPHGEAGEGGNPVAPCDTPGA